MQIFAGIRSNQRKNDGGVKNVGFGTADSSDRNLSGVCAGASGEAVIRQERVRSDNHGKEGNEALKNR